MPKQKRKAPGTSKSRKGPKAKAPKPPWKASALKSRKKAHGIKAASKKNKPPKKESAGAKPQARAGVKKTMTLRRDEKGIVYLPGCDVPIWRLIMAEQAGSSPAALIEAFPGLTPSGLQVARRYAARYRKKVDDLIQTHGPKEVRGEAKSDGDEDFERELSAMLDRDAALYRRLAR